MGITLDLMPLEDKLPDTPPPKTMVVRYGYLKEIGEFPSDLTSKVGCGSKLIVRTDRGTEIAEMLTTTCGNGGCGKSITRDKLLEYIEKSGGKDYPFSEAGRVLRVATVQDLAEQEKLEENKRKHVDRARELVAQLHLHMKIVDVEYLLGGERILFYFTSEQRVDFRTLVRDLAHEMHTRIEMRQVGSRDEARITADYEKCGQHCCCKQFLKVLTPISMRSAKVQKATLDPTKISGRCGRLMCCLRYEDETYEELRKKLPRRNTRVKTEKGDAWVIDGQILTQLVLCQFDDGTREAIPMEKMQGFDQPKPLMSDGRVMQTPNDRPPMAPGMEAQGGPAPRGRGPGGPPPMMRPKPGAPAQGPVGDPLAVSGPTGGDLDDMIADAIDDEGGDPRAARPAPALPPPPQVPPQMPPQQQLPPQGQGNRGGPMGPRPPQGQGGQRFGGPGGPGGPPRPGQGPGQRPPQGQQGPRGPQGFRPPQKQGPRPGGAMPQRQNPMPPQQNNENENKPMTPPAPEASASPPPPPAPQSSSENQSTGENPT